LTVVIWKVPDEDDWHPAGGEAAWGMAQAVAARARATKDFIFRRSINYVDG
jgi:hypothetical protein